MPTLPSLFETEESSRQDKREVSFRIYRRSQREGCRKFASSRNGRRIHEYIQQLFNSNVPCFSPNDRAVICGVLDRDLPDEAEIEKRLKELYVTLRSFTGLKWKSFKANYQEIS